MTETYTEEERKLACVICKPALANLCGCKSVPNNGWQAKVCICELDTARRVIAAGYRRLPDEPAQGLDSKEIVHRWQTGKGSLGTLIGVAQDTRELCRKHYGDERP